MQLRFTVSPFLTLTGDGDVSIILKDGLQAEAKSDRKTIESIGKYNMLKDEHSNWN